MSAQILDGKAMSAEIRGKIAARVKTLKQRGTTPGLAVILVGNDPASEIYVRNKERGCEETGMLSRTIRMDGKTTQADLEEKITDLATFPEKYSLVTDPVLNAWGIHLTTVKNYLIFYTVSEEEKCVYIIRFLHSKQNWNAILGHGFSLE